MPLEETYAQFDGNTLTVGNAFIERSWRLQDGLLYASSLTDRVHGYEWASDVSDVAGLVNRPPVAAPSMPPSLSTRFVREGNVGAEQLQAELSVRFDDGPRTYRISIFHDLPAVGLTLVDSGHAIGTVENDTTADIATEGIEVEAPIIGSVVNATDVIDALRFDPRHCWLRQASFVEQTDHHTTLMSENRWSVHPSEKLISLVGNVFYLEQRPTQAGLAMVKIAPGPDFRTPASECDLELRNGQLVLRGHGVDGGAGYTQWVISYHGGRTDRITAVQSLQQRLRPYVTGRDGILMSNTWGDRSRDGRISDGFLRAEIESGRDIGVEVVQIDDGWQRGKSANSQQDDGTGVWEDFWAIDPDFWEPHADRFPDGLRPVVDACRQVGAGLGLWYAPDSSSEFQNWKRDADQVLFLWSEFSVRHVKIDAVALTSKLAEERLCAFYDHVLAQSQGDVTFDADVTASIRLGYWGQPHSGTIFVENRYTDWANYWPHQTLRTIWLLSHHIHPMRLRMEFLNPDRNQDLYPDDPLAPSRYSPAALFASVMVSSPLAWCELSQTSPEFRSEIGALVGIWKEHRDAIYTSAIIPVGDEPDGYSWCGFVTNRSDGDLYAVVYRPLDSGREWTFELPRRGFLSAELLSGSGRAHLSEPTDVETQRMAVEIDEPLGYVFVRLES